MVESNASVLIVDAQTGRSSALAHIYSKSPLVEKIYLLSDDNLAYINCREKLSGKCLPLIHHTDIKSILEFVQKERIDLVDVAQDDSIHIGVVDALKALNKKDMLVLGPTQKAGKLEWDKLYARQFMVENGIPSPGYSAFYTQKSGLRFLESFFEEEGHVIKARFPAEGKGVVVARNKEEALEGVWKMGELPNGAGRNYLIEQLVGGPKAEEFSAFYLLDSQSYLPLGFAQDHKRIFDRDQGPNTGGMGCVSPTSLISEELRDRIEKEVVEPTVLGLKKMGVCYQGVLYVGGMYDPDSDDLWVIEYNSRWGDPEAEVILPGIKNDYYELACAAATGNLAGMDIKHDELVRVSVAGAALGYPGDYSQVKGRKVLGLDEVIKCGMVDVYGAGIDANYKVTGGRIFHLVAAGVDINDARRLAYGEMSGIYILGNQAGDNWVHFRSDIGIKEVQRNYLKSLQ